MKRIFENVEGNQFKLSEDETMYGPEEKREVQIGTEIKNLAGSLSIGPTNPYAKHIQRIIKLADELIKMHGAQS